MPDEPLAGSEAADENTQRPQGLNSAHGESVPLADDPVDANELFVIEDVPARKDVQDEPVAPYTPPSEEAPEPPPAAEAASTEIDESAPMVLADHDDDDQSQSMPPQEFHTPNERYADDGDSGGPETGRVIVRYGQMRQIGEFRHSLAVPPTASTKVVARTERGVELGEVLMAVNPNCATACHRCINDKVLRDYIQGCGEEYPYRRDGKILRLANPQDVIDQRHLETGAREEGTYCRQQIRELNLPMRLVTVEHLLGGERIIFYFSAETRVDFRELVRRLATQYRTRIEMRQVGARDEARLVADYERCGQRCCCQQFLKDLKPVSMRMAKTQKATLDPSKISGRCGRLMCCLRYEDVGYEELRKKLPRKNIWVKAADGTLGKVLEGQILTQLVRVLLPDFTQAVIANEDIVERDVPSPEMAPPREDRRPRRELKEKVPPRMLRDESEVKAQELQRHEAQADKGLDKTDQPPADEELLVRQPSVEPTLDADMKDEPASLVPAGQPDAADRDDDGGGSDDDGDDGSDGNGDDGNGNGGNGNGGEEAKGGPNAQGGDKRKRRRRRRRGRRRGGPGGGGGAAPAGGSVN